MRICRIATVPSMFAYHLRSQIKATIDKGHDVFLVSSPEPELSAIAEETGAHTHAIVIARTLSFWSDLRSLLRLYFYFRRMRFDVVHSLTAKGGLLTAIAGFVAHIPIRLHTFTGQPWKTLSGPSRSIAKACDWMIMRLNTRCYADSTSQKNYLIAQKVAKSRHIEVLGNGSLSGVDFEKFNQDTWKPLRREILRDLNIPETAKIINFTGRINSDKGIEELFLAFEELIQEKRDIFLLLVGPFEEKRSPLSQNLIKAIHKCPQIRIVGNTPLPEKFFSVSDLLCLPSYREGFGTVVIEAAAMGIPAVGTRVEGLVDAILSDVTGVLVPPKDVQRLKKALRRLLDDDSLRTNMGEAAKKRAYLFDEKIINTMVVEGYDRLANC